jgi:hypothetical protein
LKIVGYPKKALIRQIIIGVPDIKGIFLFEEGSTLSSLSELEIALQNTAS